MVERPVSRPLFGPVLAGGDALLRAYLDAGLRGLQKVFNRSAAQCAEQQGRHAPDKVIKADDLRAGVLRTRS